MSATAFQRMRREKIAKMRAEAEQKEQPKAFVEFTNKELKALLDKKGLEYEARATKETLIKLLEGAE